MSKATLTRKASNAIAVAARKAERTKQRHSRFMARTLSIYRGQQARLRKQCRQDDAMLPYTLEQFRAFFQAGLDAGCAYTAERLTLKTAAVDHDYPIADGGSWDLSNLVICTQSANWQKGRMSGREYRAFLAALPGIMCLNSQADVKRRLSAGGKMLSMNFRRAA